MIKITKKQPEGVSAKNIDNLWNRIGKKLKSKGAVPADVGKAVKAVRKGIIER